MPKSKPFVSSAPTSGVGQNTNIVRLKKPKNVLPKYLTPEELRAVLSVIKSARDRAMVIIAVGRGLRASEIGRLQLWDLRLEVKRLLVHRLKNGNSGEYLLSQDEVSALRAWLRVRGKLPGPLFRSRERNPISRQRIWELFRGYAMAAGLPAEKCHPHCMRHTCATTLLSEQGLGLAEVQDHLGHADIRSTQIYAKITNKRRDQVGEQLARDWRIG